MQNDLQMLFITPDRMNEIEMLTKQTQEAYQWTHQLIDSVPDEKWDDIADGIESNISWQVGHLVITTYYHAIMTTVGHISELIEKLNLREYTKMCSFDTTPMEMVGKTTPERLRSDLIYMQDKSLEVIKSLSPEDLQDELEPTKIPHPVAKIKFEAIDWNIKHVMWHCGQIASIKRIVDKAYDFGLRRP